MLLDDIKNGESDQLEFKETPNRESGKWLKTVVAFANCRGGRIVFGVKNSRKVVGLNGDLFAMKDGIADAVANACEPSIPVDVCMSTVEGKSVIVLTIEEGRQTPYYIKAKGDVEGVYVRYDATTRVADEMSLRELRVNGTGRGYDEMECRGLKVSDEDVAALCAQLYEEAKSNAKSEAERKLVRPLKLAQLVKWGVLTERGKRLVATNAYALLAGSDLFAPAVKCGVFRGTTRSVFVDQKKFVGPIAQQMGEAYKYVLSKINLGARFGKGIHRDDVYEIPPSAIREVIVNAFAHRTYVNGEESPITIALYDDRLEVTSPGKLPHGVTVAKMMDDCSECRNKALVQALAYMNIIEDWGSGIPRIRGDLKEAGLRDLGLADWPNAVRAVIYRALPPNAGRKVAEGGGGNMGGNTMPNTMSRDIVNDIVNEAEQLFVAIKDNPGQRMPFFVDLLKKSDRTLKRYLIAELKDRVEFRGAPKTGGYYVKEAKRD